MPAAWVAAAGAVAGALNSGDAKGGSQTVSKDPWSAAAPWLTSNLATGQNLQNYYQANPFNSVQQASYGNLFAGNDYINQMVPGLLAQFSQGGGFDRNNPRGKPAAIQFPLMQQHYQPTYGLLGSANGTMNTQANPFASQMMQPPPAAAPEKQANPTDGWTITDNGWTWLGGGSAPGVDPFHLNKG